MAKEGTATEQVADEDLSTAWDSAKGNEVKEQEDRIRRLKEKADRKD